MMMMLLTDNVRVVCGCAAAGNESPVTAYMKSAGLMFENRESFGALVLFIEVRPAAAAAEHIHSSCQLLWGCIANMFKQYPEHRLAC
jgi:hypothetical protein